MTNHERRLKEQRKLERAAEKLKKEGTDRAINILQVLPCYILGRGGYGNVRLEKFIKELYRLTNKVVKDERLLQKLQSEAIKEFAEKLKKRFYLSAGRCVVNVYDIDNLVEEMTEADK